MTAISAIGGMFPVPTILVSISPRTVSAAGVTPSVTATYTIADTGNVTNHAGTVLEAWLDVGAVASFEVRATLTSGATPSGTLGSWLPCSISRSWSVTDADAADGLPEASTILVEIRNASTLVVLTSASITITAEKTI